MGTFLRKKKNNMSDKVSAVVELAGVLKGHGDMVNCIVAGFPNSQEDEDAILVSGSRDKSLIIWKLDYRNNVGANEENCGRPWKCLTGHNHFISDLTISNDNTFVISSSWDKTMRLWDLRHGKCVRRFVNHNKEVLTTTFSTDNRQIFSGGADKTMYLWNTLAECKMTSSTPPHPQPTIEIGFQELDTHNQPKPTTTPQLVGTEDLRSGPVFSRTLPQSRPMIHTLTLWISQETACTLPPVVRTKLSRCGSTMT